MINSIFPTRPISGEHGVKVCRHTEPNSGSQGRPQLVVLPGQTLDMGFPIASTGPKHDNRIQCLQYGLGSSTRRNSDWSMVNDRGLKSHKLPQATSSLSSNTIFCKTEVQHHYSPENGQHHSSDIHKQNGGHPFSGTFSASPDGMELECMWYWCLW